ncbi:CRISPR-associated protein Cas4 [Halarchaeum sp. P4]|uniref:CRISPR-associated protein Cas4 n=1 Tax=Halarchaeum sp. P4 TaxID=3421639 RepID=UPI003EC05C51
MSDSVTFSDLATAAYCPRQLYYRRRDDDRGLPESVERTQALAHEYPTLVEASDTALAGLVVPKPAEYRARLGAVMTRWPALVAPAETDVLLTGKDCRGMVAKVLSDPLAPTLVSPGNPPEQGVWEPQKVRAVAAAKALAWREEESVSRAYVEYPRHGVVREVTVSTRAKAAYRRVLRTVRRMDGPPSRLGDDAKCGACEYRTECGVRTRTLASLL